MMIKKRTKFALIAGIGLSLFSGLSHTAFEKEDGTALVITNPSAPARLGALALIHDEEGFSVLNKSEIRRIPNHLVARDLREISQSAVMARLDNHINFHVQQGSDGEYSLQEGGGLNGGGDRLNKFWNKCFKHDAMGTKAVALATENLKDIVEPAVAAVSVSIVTNAAATEKLGDVIQKSNELAAAAGPYVMYGTIITLAGVGLYKLIPRAYNAYQRSYNPTLTAQNEEFFQQIDRDFNACLSEHPPEEGTVGIHPACRPLFNRLKTVTDAMKMREATQSVENEHNAQQVILDSEESIRQNPLAEDTVGIPSACIGRLNQLPCIRQLNQLKTEAKAMNVHEDTTQN